jgi:two-component system, LuxR family, sensor kinase FixL
MPTRPAQSTATAKSAAERAHFVVAHSSDTISVHTPYDWIYVEVNPAIFGLLGYRPEEILGKPALDFYHPDDAASFRDNTAKMLYRCGVYTKQYRLKHRDGHYIWVESTHRSVRDPLNGKLVEIVCVSRDMTARVEAEQQSRRLAAVVQSSSDLILFFDGAFTITYANASAEQAFGKAARDGGTLADILGQAPFDAYVASVWPKVKAQGVWTGQFQFAFGPELERIATIEEVLVTEDAQHLPSCSLIARDITLQIKAEEEARRHRTDMTAVSRRLSVGEMASVLAHEINQPLGTIANYAHGALRRLADGQIAKLSDCLPLFERIAAQADRAGEIIRRLRSIVKCAPYQQSAFQINDVCRDAVAFMEQEIGTVGGHIVVDLDPNAGQVVGDRVQIEQVLVNLLQNAGQAIATSPPERREITLKTHQQHRDHCIISLGDSGEGIAPDRLEAIFAAYATTRKYGLGLGLSIVRSIVEAHLGAIWAESDGIRGARFHVRLLTS